ncbi:S9 family peptidase [Jiangella ureilytica]|uniref:S9 family peptidase n=1 Tax=Jiangella ureilytica TaxID=2530374 RepID=A0A4R4RXC6_9ACTN|nr:DPP IV N-terminal domain-containing protein [Jiangella ureilytica]TDC53283.1 S9 family peptidase [Jiangella ureilytica]
MTSDRLPRSAYERAERMMGHHRSRLALRASVRPRWTGDGGRFWYRVDTERGTEFVQVDPAAGTRVAAFDHERLATALASAGGETVQPYALPFDAIELSGDAVEFEAFEARWSCRLDDYICVQDDSRPRRTPLARVSPDRRWVAFRRGHDLWVRSVATGEELPLTTDGTAERSYATNPDVGSSRWFLRRLGVFEPVPVLAWSPDSRRILTHRTDHRGVATMPLVEAAPADGGRPLLHTYRYAIPGETLPRGEWVVFDVATRTVVPAATDPFPLGYVSPLRFGNAWWSADGSTAYYLEQPRDLKTLRLKSIDAATGEVRTLVEETGQTRVEAAQSLVQKPMVHVLAGGREALWYSQRDGWGHLYLYDLTTGQPVAQVTKGEYAVQEILHVDETTRTAHLSVSGLVTDDPYRRSLVSVGLDGGNLTRLTDDDLDHVVTASPDGRWYVDSASTVDTPPVTTLRDHTGAVVLELERADITRLLAAGWTPPERVRTLAADGVTPIYGVLYKPYGFDPTQKYPVVDHPYPGPQIKRVEAAFDCGRYGHDAEAVAALGLAVLAVDGRGTPGRDKAFHDHTWGNMGAAGSLEDHVAALHQLAETRPWLDLDRVGIFGLSGGGFATGRALLAFPDLYKVGVAEAGNHDNRAYHAMWAETYHGPYDPDAGQLLSNTALAENLVGKLLLIHGEMDDNVTPHLTMRLVDRLIAANKDFDLLIVPNAEHSFAGYQHYVARKRWDYLVRHLLGVEPPEYRLAPVPVDPDVMEFYLS